MRSHLNPETLAELEKIEAELFGETHEDDPDYELNPKMGRYSVRLTSLKR